MINVAFNVRELLALYDSGTETIREKIAIALERIISPESCVILESSSPDSHQKIPAIKIVRSYTHIGLKDAKDWVEGLTVTKFWIPSQEAEQMKRELDNLGYRCRIENK